jgi:trans-aconitate 2-methyltransferase
VTAPSPPGLREWDSRTYHSISAPQVSWGKNVLAKLSLRGDETVLDAGCGTGRLTADLAGLLPRGRVIAADQSINMLRAAREFLSPFGSRVELVLASVQTLPFRDAFDGIFSTATFHWVQDHDRLFASLFAALGPGGWLRAQCGGAGNLDRLLARVSRLSATPPYAASFAGYESPWEFADAETSARRLQRAGFVEIAADIEEAPVFFSNLPEYREFLRAVILRDHIERIADPQLQKTFLDELARAAEKDRPMFALDYWRLNLRARKPLAG